MTPRTSDTMTSDSTTVCAKCLGTGAYEVREKWTTAMGEGEGLSTHPCACRESLPPRAGVAQWWSMETVFSETLPVIGDDVTVQVRPEVPMSADNYRVHRRGNRYWPTLVDLSGVEVRLSMHPDEARKLAALLVRAGDVADAIDSQDTDTCGHWAPCDCGHKAIS